MKVEAKAYVPGRHCPRGRHSFDEDRGSWARCVRCGSTATKPRGMDLATWKALRQATCPECGGVRGRAFEGKWRPCALCGGDGAIPRMELAILRRRHGRQFEYNYAHSGGPAQPTEEEARLREMYENDRRLPLAGPGVTPCDEFGREHDYQRVGLSDYEEGAFRYRCAVCGHGVDTGS